MTKNNTCTLLPYCAWFLKMFTGACKNNGNGMGAGSQLFYLRIFAVLFSDFLISYKTIKLQRHIFYNDRNTEDPRYNDSVCYQRFCCKIDFAVIKKFEMDASKA